MTVGPCCNKYGLLILPITLLSRVTSHYVIDQSLISIYDMKNMFGEEATHNPLDSTSKQISYLISYRQKLNKVIEFPSDPCSD